MKNRLYFSFIAILFFAPARIHAQSPVRFYDMEKVGYKDIDGAIIIPAQFDAGSDFNEGLAIVIKDRLRGYINEKGETVIPFQYQDAGLFQSGFAKVKQNGKYGFIGLKGEIRIPIQFDFADDFSENLSRVSVNGKFGFIDISGNWVIQPVYTDAKNFREGLAAVKNSEWGFIDPNGAIKIPFQFSAANYFVNGEATAVKDHELFVIDKNGNILREIEKEENEGKE